MHTADHHSYTLNDLEGPGTQVVQFVKKEPVSPGATEMRTVFMGTTNEEFLRVVIDRIQSQNEKFPCRENSVSLTHLETALLWMEKRTRDRKARGVEGKATA